MTNSGFRREEEGSMTTHLLELLLPGQLPTRPTTPHQDNSPPSKPPSGHFIDCRGGDVSGDFS